MAIAKLIKVFFFNDIKVKKENIYVVKMLEPFKTWGLYYFFSILSLLF